MATTSPARGSDPGPPPAYTAQDDQVDALVTGTQHLTLTNLDDQGELPTVDQTLAHLKLLHAIYALRTSVSNTDGLFGLHDDDVISTLATNEKANVHDRAQLQEALLARIKEKRWAVYVARAAQRFDTWWAALQKLYGGESLNNTYMKSSDFELSVRPSKLERIIARKEDLPPLDVLMVWHAFMLNPRCYLEDCLRQGMMLFWHNGMPWAAIDASIDVESEEYLPAGAQQRFESLTDLKWSNLDAAGDYLSVCPNHSCRTQIRVSITDTPTKDIVQWVHASMKEGLQSFPAGTGYADSGFEAVCHWCRHPVNHTRLRAAKFRADSLSAYNGTGLGTGIEETAKPMPGTVLNPDGAAMPFTSVIDTRYFPNRLLRGMIQTGQSPLDWESIEQVRDNIESALKSPSLVMNANLPNRGRVLRDARVNVRRMMSRYWENSSPFALDLVGAVIRQATFIEKMENIDWLHSPTAASTVSRLVRKYERFFHIMSTNPGKLIVPTLDVDLAWHTHQLSPVLYYGYSYTKTRGKFIDHDDKISETALSSAFAETSRIYQKLYKEPYSECTCWYCETIRASHDSGVSSLFNRPSVADKTLYDPKNPNHPTSDPDKGPHISAHSAIHPATPIRGGANKTEYDRHIAKTQKELAIYYEKACKRAKKAGRAPPPPPPFMARDYDRNRAASSGYMYYPLFFLPIGMPYYGYGCDGGVYAANPSCANFSPGAAGNCAAGSCGGGVAAGACGGAAGAGCAAGGAGCAGGAAGCAGGGGGGCGGGGGGCGGGGGGGGCGGGGGG